MMTGLANPPARSIEVVSPYSNERVGEVCAASHTDVQRVADLMMKSAKSMASLTRLEKSQILDQAASRVERDLEAYARLIALEAGKPITHARNEVRRCINTLKLSSHAALELHGETVPFDAYSTGANRTGYFTREPIGPVLAITPFNDPLNLVAHKIGPAIAAGNSIVLKPSEKTPLCAARLATDLVESGLPSNGFTVLNGGPDIAKSLLKLPFRLVSFTGGFVAAESIVAAGGVKKYAMDLGGNAAVLVMPDSDLDRAVESCVSGAFGAAGQNCIGVQRILVHNEVFEQFQTSFVAAASSLKVGDPMSETTEIGPMITQAEAKRAEQWTNEAIHHGGTLLHGQRREGALFWPTALTDVSKSSKVWRQEVFCPVVSLAPFNTIDEAIDMANDSEIALHAGVFTERLDVALDAADRLEAAGVMVNDSSDYRFDGMPFGGFKKGSMGREGVKFAIEEMTQTKTICIAR